MPSQEILKIRDDVPTNVVQRKRVAHILFFKIRPSQEILKIRDGTPMEAEEILIYIKKPSNKSVWHFSSKLDILSNVVQKKRVARILFFKIRPSQEILKIRDEILKIRHEPSQEILKIRHVHKKRVARILFIKIRPSQEILKIRDGTSLETEEILTYIKSPQNRSVWHFSSNLDVPSNEVQKKRVARIFNLDVPTNVVQRKRVAHILFFKIRPSQEILKIRDGTPMEAEEILIYIKKPSNKSVWHFSSNLDVPTNVVQKKRVARILFFKIRPSQEILKIRDGTPFNLDVPTNVVQRKRVAHILFFKIRPSQEILKIRDGTPMEAEEILIYIKKPSNKSVWHFSSNLDVPTNVVQKKRVARILFFKIRPSQEILKIRDGTPFNLDVPTNVVQRKRVAHILFFKIRPSQEILKIRDGTPMEAEEILIYIKKPSNKSVWHFSSNLDVPTNVVQKKRVARILFFKIRPSQEILKIRDGTPFGADSVFKIRTSQEILKIRDGTPLETEEILIYIKKPSNKSVWHFSSNLDVPINVVHKKRVARILFFKIRPSQEILKIRHGTPLETEEILTYIKSPQNRSFWHFYSNLDVPNNVVHKKRVARILFIKIRPSQEILKIRDGTSLETEEILTYIKSPQNRSVWHFSSNLDVPSNEVQKKRVRKRVAHILFFKIRPSQEILKIRDGTPMEAEEILIYIKKPSNKSVWHFSSKLDILSNVVQKKRVARILFFKIRPSQEILKIRHGTPLETEEILTYIKSPQNRSFWHFYSNLDVPSNVVHKKRVARILFIKIRPSQEILKIRDGTSLETEEILTYIKSPQNRSVFVQRKRVAHILFFKIRPYQEILKIRDGTPMEAEEILIYIKSPQNKSVWHFSSNLDVPSNVVQKKRVARIMFFKIRPSQEIQKIRDGTPMEAEEILIYIKSPKGNRPSQEILKIRDGTPLEAEEILIYIKRPSNKSVWHFSSNLDVPINVVQKKRVVHILFFKIRPSQEILKIRDGTPMEAEEILIYIKSPQNKSVWHFSSNLDVPSNVVHNKRVARILFSKLGHLKKF
ncbi:hypothetical protein OROMI_001637 [Orobanche minor]